MPPCGSPYRAVLHAVAVDGAYDTTPEILSGVLRRSLQTASQLSAHSVAITALATGYGRKPIEFFADALTTIMAHAFSPVHRVIIGLRLTSDVDEMVAVIPELEVIW
jgi:O-acetyl-ADP-ribose deacetylase